MPDSDLLENLKKWDAFRDDDKWTSDVLPMEAPKFVSGENIFESIDPKLKHALEKSGITEFYEHQSESILKALEGNTNIVLQAPTASGKTLSFQIPVLDTLIRDKNAHALFIYPMKALSFDQRDQLLSLTNHLSVKIDSWWYDGDVSPEDRKIIRECPPKILITTPEMINFTFLAYHHLWEKFLKNLKWIVIDEMHEYRGYFGSHFSLLMRRFINFLNQKMNSNPQIFLSSATCANAVQHAENLTGLKFDAINANVNMRPKRHYHFINPTLPPHRYWQIFQWRIIKAGLACLEQDKSVLIFCPTVIPPQISGVYK